MRLFIFLLAFTFPAVGLSQGNEENLRRVQCRFLSFGGPDKPTTVVSKGRKDAEIICALSSSKISDPTTCYASGNKIRFTSEGEKKPIAVATIPSGIRAAILIFIPSPNKAEAKLPWRVMVIEDSAKNFPDGGVFIANFHNDDIRFIIGEHKGALHPGKTGGYARPTKRDTFNMAPVIFEFRNKNKWRIGNESALRFLPSMRYLVFAYTDPASKRPRINTYQDFRSVAKPIP